MLTIREELFQAPKKNRQWKNVGLLNKTLQELKERGLIQPGGDIDTAVIAQIIRDNNLHTNWDLALKPEDEHGLIRSIGDTIGGHGLGLAKQGRSRHYIMPDILPRTKGDEVIEEAVYKDYVLDRIISKDELAQKAKSASVSTYLAILRNVAGVFCVRLDFDGVAYSYATSSKEQLLDILNPVACDKDRKSTAKDDVRKAIDKTLFGAPVQMLLNPSIYQKLYGAHSPGKAIFQKVVVQKSIDQSTGQVVEK